MLTPKRSLISTSCLSRREIGRDGTFIGDALATYRQTSVVLGPGPLQNSDRLVVGVAAASSFAKTFGGYTVGQWALSGFQPPVHLSSQAATARLVAGTTAFNAIAVGFSYEAGNAAGSLLRSTVNRTFRGIEDWMKNREQRQ
jgi:hypothetical protein